MNRKKSSSLSTYIFYVTCDTPLTDIATLRTISLRTIIFFHKEGNVSVKEEKYDVKAFDCQATVPDLVIPFL